MRRVTLFMVVFAMLLVSGVSAEPPGRTGFGLDLGECGPGTTCIRALWPDDVSKPGEDLFPLFGEIVKPATPEKTPIGPAMGRRIQWTDGSGKMIAETELLEIDGGEAWVIETTLPGGFKGPTGDYYTPHFALPAITPPSDLTRVFTFTVDAFSPPAYEPVATTGPVMVYNDDLEAIVMSPLENFMEAMNAPGEDGDWRFGFGGMLESVPEGTVHKVLVVKGTGVNETFEKWGDIIRAWHNHERQSPYADVGVAKLGYYTDNGAYYYYKDAPGMNYHETLIAVKEYADLAGIPYGYFQIDSWWYPKAKSNTLLGAFRGGSMVWEPIPSMFPEGLDTFHEKLGLPLVAHNRWYDRNSPYCDRYDCVYGEGDKTAALPTNPEFWNEIMDNAVSYGVEVYEQDWLLTQMNMIPWLRSGWGNARGWFDAMVDTADSRDLTMQLCMASPEFFLQQMKHDNVTHVRTSGDYQAGLVKTYFWPKFHATSMFAHAVGMWPFKDNFQSKAGQRTIRDEKWAYEEALISNMSAGPVGPSDKIGESDPELLMKTCREDGVLLKPDRPATPIDLMFLDTKKPWIVTTESEHEIGTSHYVMAFNLWPMKRRDRSVTFAELGAVGGEYALYNHQTRELIFDADRIDFGKMKKNEGGFYMLLPVLENGMVVIGEAGKFASLSAKRFNRIHRDEEGLYLEVEGVPGEVVNVSVYMPCAPTNVLGCKVPEVGEDFEEGVVTVSVTIPETGVALVTIE